MEKLLAVLAVLFVSNTLGNRIDPKVVNNVSLQNASLKFAVRMDASEQDAPWQVSLVSSGLLGDRHKCGGAWIGPRTVITAARCCNGERPASLKVKYGGLDRTSLSTTNQVTQLIIHQQWNENTQDYDYCLVRLTDESAPDIRIRVSDVRPEDGTVAYLTGWGMASDSISNIPTSLQRVQLSILNQLGCDERLSDVNFHFKHVH